jgi:hypothetical protein
MHPRIFVASVMLLLSSSFVLPVWASAAVVGHLTQVEGRVDLLRRGQLPAIPVKLQDKVESGDLLRTKSQSQAQVTFLDNSILTIFPESRVGIEEYRFDTAKGKRMAVLQLFQGQAHAVILKAVQDQQPDFVIKTHTAVVKARGAELGCRIYPNFSTIMNFAGHSSVINISPDVKEEVNLNDMQSTTVAWFRSPTPRLEISAEDRRLFMASTGLKDGNHVGGPVAADVVAPGASTVSRDLGLNIRNPVMPGQNVLANPALLGPQQAPSAPVVVPNAPSAVGPILVPGVHAIGQAVMPAQRLR